MCSARLDLRILETVGRVLGSLCILSCVHAAPPNDSPVSNASAEVIDFDRDIRPILADVCFQCHGPDKEQRQTELRLDVRGSAFADLGDYHAIVPGQPRQSELYRRVTSTDDNQRMPPPESGRSLSKEQIERLTKWIAQGAIWKEHWAFTQLRRPPSPIVAAPSRAQNPVDRFILARLAGEGLSASKPADKTTLLRRLTLDLTGLPPDPSDIAVFLADQSPDAYERRVDRLLASPRFGERMALPWLDAARYADTSGYQNDGPRYMWRWRDWVIDVLNQNMPFDQFTIEQLAGDMLPEATLQQQIATGFNRNHRGNAEGGIIPEEYAVEYVVDRVETTSTVWLGLTIGCARCHDHKFDPISQREFYQFFAFFNNVPEFGRAVKEGNSPPYIKAPTERQAAELRRLDSELAEAQSYFHQLEKALDDAQLQWEHSSKRDVSETDTVWTLSRNLIARFDFNRPAAADFTQLEEAATTEIGNVAVQDGKIGNAASFDGTRDFEVGDVGDFGYFDKFSISAWIRPQTKSAASQQSIVSRMTDSARASGYSVTWHDGHVHVNLVKRWLDDAIRVRSKQLVPANEWAHVCVTYDGSRRASGIRVYLDGEPAQLEVDLDLLNQSFNTTEPLRVGGGGGPDARFVGLIDDVHIYDGTLSLEEVQVLAAAESIAEIISCNASARTRCQQQKLRAFFLDRHAPEVIRRAHQQLTAARDRRREYWEAIPTVMVMKEARQPRETFVLHRGQYDQPKDQVSAATPSCLPPLPTATKSDRLALARWIVDPTNPLTARVAVNRYWQMLFGTGLVETPEDFGAQGLRPSHPLLLDWLATEFLRSDWDVKSLLKTIVTSATYRQSSNTTIELLRRDPQNRLLARGPRFRLRAEMIRDQALAASGLLVEKLGGPSVRPHQPEGLWKEIATDTDYQQSKGEGLYRRSMYSYWKRTVAPPSMVTFDASTRETCVVRATRTNTPLQALTLMNDVTFWEASRALAQRIMRDRHATPEQRLNLAFQLAVGRKPSNTELKVLADGFRFHQQKYRNDPSLAHELVRAGDYSSEQPLNTAERDAADLAAYMVAASLILNLDETVTKE